MVLNDIQHINVGANLDGTKIRCTVANVFNEKDELKIRENIPAKHLNHIHVDGLVIFSWCIEWYYHVSKLIICDGYPGAWNGIVRNNDPAWTIAENLPGSI